MMDNFWYDNFLVVFKTSIEKVLTFIYINRLDGFKTS